MARGLLILGAGQFGFMVKEIAEEMHRFDKIDFLDDYNPQAIGKLSDYVRFRSEYPSAVVAIGNPSIRMDYISKLNEAGFAVEVLVSPNAYVSPSAVLQKGTIVEPNATVQTGAYVSVGTIISSGAVVRHNAVVGEGCHLDCNSVLMSNVHLPPRTKLSALSSFTKEDE